MSRFEAYLLRGALVYLLLTGAFGVAFTMSPGLAAVFGPTHAHLGLVGFFLSTVMGVAFWMMPRPGGVRQEGWEAATFALLNVGLVLRLVGEPWLRLGGGGVARVLFVASGWIVLAAMLAFALAMSRRIVTVDVLRARSSRRRASRRD